MESPRPKPFSGFIEGFKDVVLLLETPEDYALATTRLIESLAAQNVRYAEITLSAGVVLWKKQPLEAVFEASESGLPTTRPWRAQRTFRGRPAVRDKN